MATDISALSNVIKLIVDAGKDTVAAIQPNQSVIGRFLAYENLIGDLFSVVPSLGEIPAEVAALSVADYAALAAVLAQDIAANNANATAVINAALKVLQDVVAIVPDVEALVAAVKPAPAK